MVGQDLAVIGADFGTGQVLWSVLWLSLFVLWVWLVLTLFTDIARSDLSGPGKALWAFGILVLPLLGAVLYLIVNGDEMERRWAGDAASSPAIDAALTARTTADRLAVLAAAHDSGAISDAEFAATKTQLLAE